jgi:transcriptional regulator with XRE-family HTH domain
MGDAQKAPLRGRTLGARIREAYEARGWSRADFQRRLQSADESLEKLNYTTIIAWENDRKIPKMKTVGILGRVLGYTMDELSTDPKDESEVPAGTLSDQQVTSLLEKLGGSSELKAAVIADLTAYPPKGGVTRDEVVRVHRLLSRAYAIPSTPEPDENAELDAELDKMGVARGEPEDLRRGYAETMKRPPAAPRKTRRAR